MRYFISVSCRSGWLIQEHGAGVEHMYYKFIYKELVSSVVGHIEKKKKTTQEIGP